MGRSASRRADVGASSRGEVVDALAMSPDPGDDAPPAEVHLSWRHAVDQRTQAGLVETWVEVTNAGGGVGYLPPITAAEVTGATDRIVERVTAGVDDLLVATVGERIVAWVLLERDSRAFAAHWRMVKRLQVRPDLQRRGLGGRLLSEVARYSRDVLGLEFLLLTVRDGTGASALYERMGYVEVGRVAAAMRIAEGDDRDEIYMRLDLNTA